MLMVNRDSSSMPAAASSSVVGISFNCKLITYYHIPLSTRGALKNMPVIIAHLMFAWDITGFALHSHIFKPH